MKIYYEKFQPKSLIEALFLNNNNIKNAIVAKWPALPWLNIAIKPGKNYQHFGPNLDHFGKIEFKRTIDLYKQLSKMDITRANTLMDIFAVIF